MKGTPLIFDGTGAQSPNGEVRRDFVNLEICNFEIDFGPMPVHNFGPINFAILFILSSEKDPTHTLLVELVLTIISASGSTAPSCLGSILNLASGNYSNNSMSSGIGSVPPIKA